MKKTTKVIIIAILVAVLLLGIGYAAIQNITLNIAGKATADPSQSNFKVMFTGTPEVSDSTYVTAGITDDTNATINVRGLTTKGQIVSATYIVQNVSTDLSADLGLVTTNSNTEYFTISSELAKTSLVAGEATTVTVTAELIKIPIQEAVSSTVGVQITAAPVQPGEEGTSNTENDNSQQTPGTTLALVTNDNIGEYIDLGNNVIGSESTLDDWRILYKDGNTVYAILADYLPASQVPAVSVGLNTDVTEYPYSVWSYDTRDTLINELKDVWAWRSLANGIAGATITGAPTAELLMNSYNTKNGTELVHTEFLRLDSETEEYNLYVPHREVVSGCYGYWLASPREGYYIDDADAICWYDTVWGVSCNGVIVDIECYSNNGLGVRPVVSLLSAIQVELVDEVWVVE